MLHTVHATQGSEDVGMRSYPTEGPTGRAVVRTTSLQLVGELLGHVSEGSTSQGFHHDTLDVEFLAFIIEVFGIGVLSPSVTQ